MPLVDEIHEQPAVLERLLESRREAIDDVAREVTSREIDHVYLAARGSSDNAGIYAKYALGGLCSLPVTLATPSLFSVYGTPPRIGRCLIIGISQSGQSPDIVAVLEEGRRQGAPTLAITNDPTSPLARAADLVIDTDAGPERAVAATKTYTGQVFAIAMLAAALAPRPEAADELARIPDLVRGVLELDGDTARAAERYLFMERCVVLGRGFDYATAYEWALKLEELTHVLAQPHSSADFRHGPVAMVGRGFPILAVLAKGPVLEGGLELLTALSEERSIEILAISNEPRALALASTPLPLPDDLPEWLSPVVSIVPAQLFCFHLARVKQLDTESPRGLSKVTRTV